MKTCLFACDMWLGGFGQGLLVLRLMHLKYLGEGLIVSSLIGVVKAYDKKFTQFPCIESILVRG